MIVFIVGEEHVFGGFNLLNNYSLWQQRRFLLMGSIRFLFELVKAGTELHSLEDEYHLLGSNEGLASRL